MVKVGPKRSIIATELNCTYWKEANLGFDGTTLGMAGDLQGRGNHGLSTHVGRHRSLGAG